MQRARTNKCLPFGDHQKPTRMSFRKNVVRPLRPGARLQKSCLGMYSPTGSVTADSSKSRHKPERWPTEPLTDPIRLLKHAGRTMPFPGIQLTGNHLRATPVGPVTQGVGSLTPHTIVGFRRCK